MFKDSGTTTIPVSDVPMTEFFDGSSIYAPSALVVDDECTIADSLAEILKRSGYRVTVAYDASSALESALCKPPDVLITDVMLPGTSGIELAITLRRIYPDCKILLFSGNAATTVMMETATRTGHNFVLLNKPVHPSEMLSRIADSMRMRRGAAVGKG